MQIQAWQQQYAGFIICLLFVLLPKPLTRVHYRHPLPTHPMRTPQWALQMNRVRGTVPLPWRRRSQLSPTLNWPSWMTWSTGRFVYFDWSDDVCILTRFELTMFSFMHRPRWVVPVLPKGELEVLLEAAIDLCKKGNIPVFV